MQNTRKALMRILEWLIKFFVPPMFGAFILAISNEIHFFYENYAFITKFDSAPLKVFIFGMVHNFSTVFYWYFLMVYIPFFVYLVLLQKFNKLSLVVVMVSGFTYAQLPLLFGAVNSIRDLVLNLDNLLISLVITLSGLLCSFTYYYLHNKLSVKSYN